MTSADDLLEACLREGADAEKDTGAGERSAGVRRVLETRFPERAAFFLPPPAASIFRGDLEMEGTSAFQAALPRLVEVCPR
jgi:hypothetical protein